MDWGPQQIDALRKVKAWLKDPHGKQVFRIFGFAGVGKTVLSLEISRMVHGLCLFASFTGKAATVLRSKGCENADTIHSLIYKPTEEEYGITTFRLNANSDIATADLAIIDECSMISKDLGEDLISFGTRILVLGDPAQLPPIQGAGYFTHGPGCKPDVMLTEIHRQAADNPIIYLATKVRMGEALQLGGYGESKVIARDTLRPELVMAADQVIVGMNKTRHSWNKRIRTLKKLNPDRPVKGDKLVCLKNNKRFGLFNGALYGVEKVAKRNDFMNIWITPFEENTIAYKAVAVQTRLEFFNGTEAGLSKEKRKGFDEFTYGYALTCHKSQGSQWNNIVVSDESSVFREDAHRWLYTAITRAAEKITVAQ